LLKLDVPAGVEIEICIVDNNSTDDTKAVVQEFAKDGVRYIFEPAAGQSYARNTALKSSSGDIVVWTDDDINAEANWLSELLSCHQSLDADVVFGKVVPMWETQPPSWFSKRFHGKFALLDFGDDRRLTTNESGYGVNHSARRVVYDKVGLFRTDYGIRPVVDGGSKGASYASGGGEDSYFFLRSHKLGLRVAYCGSAVVHHFIPADRCEKDYYRRRVWHARKQHLLTFEEDTSPRLLGVPRYLYKRCVGDVGSYLSALFGGDASKRFESELKIRAFIGLLEAARHEKSRPKAGSSPA
jgi:glycosyltransferase involved in cell wall biosynthesis